MNLKRLLSAIGLLTIATPALLSVVACGSKIESEPKIDLDKIITNKKVDGNMFNTKEKVLNQIINLNNDITIKDIDIKDFVTASADENGSAIIFAKLDSKFTGEVNITITKLETKGTKKLTDVFSDFNFKDNKGVPEFLDSNDENTIKNQILKFLGKSNLEEDNLTLENWESNSIILKTTKNSKNFKGQVTLTWNLKLFEIWGINTDLKGEGISDRSKQAELKGYFYLAKDAKEIRYFDFYGYKTKSSNDVSRYESLHTFTFNDGINEPKEFAFDKNQQTNQLEELFDSFKLTDNTRINVISKVYRNVRTYDLETDTWSDKLNKETTFKVNLSGQITIE